MGSDSRKRSRSVTEENRAECPFTIKQPYVGSSSGGSSKKSAKRQKRVEGEEEKKLLFQQSHFAPRGKFKTCESLDCHYNVEPRKKWFDMTRYNSFVLNNHKYYNEGYVHVANDHTIERQKGEIREQMDPGQVDEWVAKILEIRAADEHHVYARVAWMYLPDELPTGSIEGKKTVGGRQSYHGKNELIASNHMDIINVVSITLPAQVNQWIEADDEEIQSALYWRQAYDYRTGELSAVQPTCRCKKPAHPDAMLVGCTNRECHQWLHTQCLRDEVLGKIYNDLGNDKAHVSPEGATGNELRDGPKPDAKTKDDDDEVPSIDVLGGQNGTPTVWRLTSAQEPKSLKKTNKKGAKPDPSHGLFEAELIMNKGPSRWVITDLRKGIKGGDQKWTEQVDCLICGQEID